MSNNNEHSPSSSKHEFLVAPNLKGLQITQDDSKFLLKYDGNPTAECFLDKIISVQTTQPWVADGSSGKIYFFEVFIKSLDKGGVVAIGLAPAGFPTTKHFPGWTKGSCGKRDRIGVLKRKYN